MHRMMIYIVGREWSSKCWLPGPSDDPGEKFEVMAPRPGDREVTTAALAGITGNLLVLHLLVRFLLVLHLLVRILLVLTTTAGIGISNNLSRNRTQLESSSAGITLMRLHQATVARRPPRLNSRAAATR